MLCHAMSIALHYLVLTRPSAQCHAMPCPCHALPCPATAARVVPPAWSRPSSQSSIDISAVSYPAFPTIGSQTRLHFGFRTSPTKRPVPSLARSCPACLPCPAKVGAQSVNPANLSLSACLAAPSLGVTPDSIWFALLCFASPCCTLSA
ncbi:hypothetical protein F5883DRAFT_560057 [Diaporthe sp. PMI_573]|nr:hypothetical protein F5883DRAFT_560057 [Diaporthaceae sp. PMI_573]